MTDDGDPYGDRDGNDDADRGGAEGGEVVLGVPDLSAAVMKLLGDLEIVIDRLDALDTAVAALTTTTEADADAPAEWALFEVPDHHEDPLVALEMWVQFYNATYISTHASSGDNYDRPIPGCWLQHPGLAAEIATLAATWREGFTGPGADPVAAQNFHDRWRPGFAQRLRNWTSCTLDRHATDSDASPERTTRFDSP